MSVLSASSTSTTVFNQNTFLRHAISQGAKGLASASVTEWPLWGAIFSVVIVIGALRLYRMRRLARSGIAQVDKMDGRTFEEFLVTVFRRLGYRAELTPYTGDFGADLVVTRAGVRQAVQAKRSSRAVGVKAVQEVATARRYYNCQEALVVTNRGFTVAAQRLARANDVGLWDRRVLADRLISARHAEGASRAPSEVAPVVSGGPPSPGRLAPMEQSGPGIEHVAPCATCDEMVSARVRYYCLARPGRFGGKVYCFAHQRSLGPKATVMNVREESK